MTKREMKKVMKLYARQGANGYEYYRASSKEKVWAEIASEFGESYEWAKATYQLEESDVADLD